jgi:transcriptional regulator with XRE-family HTH domain
MSAAALAGFEIDAAAKKANVVPSSLAAWEAGERRPSVKSLRRLGRVYGRSPRILLPSRAAQGFPADQGLPATAWAGRAATFAGAARRDQGGV